MTIEPRVSAPGWFREFIGCELADDAATRVGESLWGEMATTAAPGAPSEEEVFRYKTGYAAPDLNRELSTASEN
ncbi:MAG: hypothetical protein H0T17_00700 [Propionibacteriales bacterium]|nr:hypothetical protein [Propionibacteriales bacterium]